MCFLAAFNVPVVVMIRFILRFIAMMCLALAVVYGVIDAARSLADRVVSLTPLSETLSIVMPGATLQLESYLADDELTFPIRELTALVSAPTCLVMVCVAFIMFLLSRKPARRPGQFLID